LNSYCAVQVSQGCSSFARHLFMTVKTSRSTSGSGAVLISQGNISPHGFKSHICLQYLPSNRITESQNHRITE